MNTKKCSKCGEIKQLSEFYKKKRGGVSHNCKCCICLSSSTYYSKNKIARRAYNQSYQNINKSILSEKSKIRERERLNQDPQYRFKQNLKRRIREAFKMQSKNGKTKSCSEYGIDFSAIYVHIGERPSTKHHLDHIIPLSVFNLDDAEHVRLAHLPENLRWLPGKENCSKNDFVDWTLIKSDHTLLTITLLIGLKNDE